MCMVCNLNPKVWMMISGNKLQGFRLHRTNRGGDVHFHCVTRTDLEQRSTNIKVICINTCQVLIPNQFVLILDDSIRFTLCVIRGNTRCECGNTL